MRNTQGCNNGFCKPLNSWPVARAGHLSRSLVFWPVLHIEVMDDEKLCTESINFIVSANVDQKDFGLA